MKGGYGDPHAQVDGLGTAYLFFFDKQGRHGLTHETTQTMWSHIEEAFVEWIFHSAHFTVNPIPLAEGWHHMVVAPEQHRHQSWAEYQNPMKIPTLASSESDSAPQLIGSAPPSAVKIVSGEETGGGWAAQASSTRLHGRPPKSQSTERGGENSPPSSLERGEWIPMVTLPQVKH